MKQFLNIFTLIILFCCFSSIDAIACGDGCSSKSTEKKSTCCKPKDKVSSEISGCTLSKETSGDQGHNCDGECEHSSCYCSPVSFQLIFDRTIVALPSFDYFEANENHIFRTIKANICNGFSDNWIIPKIG